MGIVDVALAEEGTRESGTNNVKYNTWFYGHAVSGGDYAWCAVFVAWCANQAGVPTSVIPKEAGVSGLKTFFENQKRFVYKGKGYIPKAGDIMIQKSAGASHTGIVTGSDGTNFSTIEGNASDMVKQRTYSLNDSKLTGFGIPNYDGNPLDGTVPVGGGDTSGGGGGGTTIGNGLGIGGYEYVDYTVKNGDTLESIAKKYNTTVALIMFINGLTNQNIKAGQKLKIPKASGVLGNPTSGVGTITKKHTYEVSVSHPVIKAEFYTEQGMLATVSTTGLTKSTDVDNDIISCTTVRNMGQDCPTMNISLIWRRNWYNVLSSNDLVIIYMRRPPESEDEVFFGLIDDIRKTLDFSSGQPQRAVQITCRGFAKAFVNFDVGLIENISVNMETGFFANLMQIAGCSSYQAIKIVLDSYIGKAIQYSFANGKVFKDYFKYSGNEHTNEKLMDYTSYTSYSGSLWNFIKELSNAPFNETYWEIKNHKPNMIHRKTPFNKKEWTSLTRIIIKDNDLVSDNTGRSDLETYTLYTVNMTLLGEDTRNLYNPLWYPPYYAKYGITQLAVNTVYEATGDVEAGMKQFHEELFNFNIKNNLFANGTLVVKGSNQYKVGQRVILESENMEFYVESVTHTFNCYGTWTTSLGVTRGIEPENRFTPPFGMAEEMTPEVMNAIIQMTSGEKIDWTNLPKVDYSQYQQTGDSGGTAIYNPTGGSINGNTITLPAGLGTVYTHMGWQCITSKTSMQYKLREQAGMRFDGNGIGIINGRYVIACTTTFGKVGDYLNVKLSNGQSFKCIIGEIKNQDDSGCNKWGHQNGKSVIEFVVDKTGGWAGYNGTKTVLQCHPEWKNSSTVSITNEGSYW